jgi:hypothetical protein
MVVEKILSSDEYFNSKKKIKKWLERLDTGNLTEVMKVREEYSVFFKMMKMTNPDLYSVFAISRKDILEKIQKKLTGKDLFLG